MSEIELQGDKEEDERKKRDHVIYKVLLKQGIYYSNTLFLKSKLTALVFTRVPT